MRFALVCALAATLVSCGGESAEEADSARPDESVETSSAEVETGGAGGETPAAAAPPPAGAARDTLTGRVYPPDPCALLTADDAREILGETVGGPASFDIAGQNCSYDGTASGRRLSLIVHRGDTVESTQFGLELEYCGGEAVARREGLGAGAILYRFDDEPCGESHWLAVPTGVRFEGSEPPPDRVRPVAGNLHFVLAIFPAPENSDADAILRALGDAAERALERLQSELASSTG